MVFGDNVKMLVPWKFSAKFLSFFRSPFFFGYFGLLFPIVALPNSHCERHLARVRQGFVVLSQGGTRIASFDGTRIKLSPFEPQKDEMPNPTRTIRVVPGEGPVEFVQRGNEFVTAGPQRTFFGQYDTISGDSTAQIRHAKEPAVGANFTVSPDGEFGVMVNDAASTSVLAQSTRRDVQNILEVTDREGRVLFTRSGEQTTLLRSQPLFVTDRLFIVENGDDRLIELWEIDNRRLVRRSRFTPETLGEGSRLRQVRGASSRDHRMASIPAFGLGGEQEIHVLSFHRPIEKKWTIVANSILGSAISQDGNYLAVLFLSSPEGQPRVHIYDTELPTPIDVLEVSNVKLFGVKSLGFSENGNQFFLTTSKGTLHLWDI